MNEADALQGLASPLPSERGRAIEWFLTRASPIHLKSLTEALASEPVPSLRRQLSVALKRSTEDAHPHTSQNRAQADDPIPAEVLESLSSLIRHETEPVIGWLRRSAAQDIGPDYAVSETFTNIDLLRRRIAGLEALAAAHRFPRWTRVSLSQLVSDCRPPEIAVNEGNPSPHDDGIDTDPGLLSIIIGNALQNAQEAVADLVDGSVWIECEMDDRNFWLTITNRFIGQTFELEHIAHTGVSSKSSHKGLGVSAIRLAAQRLDYRVSLSAKGGVAFFSLRGRRFHD